MRPYDEVTFSNNNSLNNHPVFAHTSDVHGDALRFKRFMDYADFLKADAALVTGDIVAFSPSDTCQYINDIAVEHNTPTLVCTGNHDVKSLSTAEQYTQIMKADIDREDVVVNPNEDYPTYFYKDFASKKIRVISLNVYEEQLTDSQIYNFQEEQCEWFIDTLSNTPAGYGVLVMFHAPEKIAADSPDVNSFFQRKHDYTTMQNNIGAPFAHIIDAFIGHQDTTVTYTTNITWVWDEDHYVPTGGDEITVTTHFSTLNTGVEFIGYVSGHLHADSVCYVPNTTYRQLNLNVTCCAGAYGITYDGLANYSDLPRGTYGSTQDSFNIYVIDRDNGTVRIARVGSNITGYLSERKWLEIAYRDE